MINLYVNKNDLSSYLLKKYKLKEKEKNENSETKLIIEPKESESFDKRRKSINLSFLFPNKKTISEILLSNKKNEEKDNNDIINSKNSDINIIRSESSQSITSSQKKRSYSHSIIEKDKDKDKSSFTPGVSLFKLSIDESGQNNDKNTTNFSKKFKLSFQNKFAKKKKGKTSIKKKSLNILSRLINLKTFSGKNNKIKTNQIQNLENESK